MKKMLTLLLLVSCCSVCIYSQSLILATTIWPPFRIEPGSGEPGVYGIDVDIIHELEKRLSVDIEIQYHPWRRALQMVRTGDADLIIGIAMNEERSGFLNYVPTSYIAAQAVFYTQKGRGESFHDYESLKTGTIGYGQDNLYFEPFDSDSTLDKTAYASDKQILDMLALWRLDLAVGANPNMAYAVSRSGYKDKLEMISYIPPQSTPLYLALSKQSSWADSVGVFDAAIKQMLQEGTVEEILERYR